MHHSVYLFTKISRWSAIMLVSSIISMGLCKNVYISKNMYNCIDTKSTHLVSQFITNIIGLISPKTQYLEFEIDCKLKGNLD